MVATKKPSPIVRSQGWAQALTSICRGDSVCMLAEGYRVPVLTNFPHDSLKESSSVLASV
jgi:hypothetical protein